MCKKSKLTYIILLLAVITIAAAALVFAVPSEDSAEAAVSWKVRVTKQANGQYVDLSTGDNVTDTTELYFLISDYASNDNFEFYLSDNNADNNIANISQGWTNIPTDNTVDIDGKTYIVINNTFDQKANKFIYFRRKYSVTSTEIAIEHYTGRWNITINTGLNGEDLGIAAVEATFLKNNIITTYTGEWIGTGLRFAVKTAWMEKNGSQYDSGDELLYYSVDGKDNTDKTKNWIPMNTDVVTVTRSLLNATVDFKVTDVSGNNAAYGQYDKRVNIDANEPVFTVNAFTVNAAGETVSYQNRDWSCNDVIFSLADASDCISNVEYSVSTDGITYTVMETMSYTVRTSTVGLRFRATNSAGVIYDFRRNEDFYVNIDTEIPGATADAITINPDNDTENIALDAEYNPVTFSYTAGYANGQFTLRVYNKKTDGNYIKNSSGEKFYYAVKIDDGEFSQYREMTLTGMDGENTYYYIIDSITRGVSSKRVYKFYVMSGAGLRSNETTYEVTLVNPNFEIQVQEITYVPNASGWSSAPIPVYVTVPTDSVINRDYEGNITGYTAPTTKYTFYYAPTNISGVLYEAEGEYHTYVEGVSGQSIYVFYLSASAESTFTVYARNAAGKRSANTYSSANILKIDMLEPEVEVTAYIKPETENATELIYIASAEWVNGRIIVTLNVKDGVSGVYVKELRYAVDGYGNPVYDANGKMVWQESSGTLTPDGSNTGGDGSRYYFYNIEIGLPDSTKVYMSEEYRFRVYTGSGVSKDITFIANIDTTPIVLNQIIATVGGSQDILNVEESTVTLNSVCENVEITLEPNSEQKGHFDYYIWDEFNNVFVRTEGGDIFVEVPVGTKGVIRKRFYIVSRAKDYLGMSYTSSIAYPYEIVIPYNTLNIAISYELLTNTAGSIVGEWVNDDLVVRVNLLSNAEGEPKELSDADKANYTYYYMLIDYSVGLDINAAINNGTWLSCENKGEYEGNRYQFTIGFQNTSFYGYIALSVTNEAGFRSSTAGDVATLLRIDRTTPAIEDMILTDSGINERTFGEDGITTVTYYSKDNITVAPKHYSDRSDISYYYIKLDSSGNTTAVGNPTADNLNGWTQLTGSFVISAEEGESYYLFYAVNALGAAAGGFIDNRFSARYRFIIDTGVMRGSLSYNPLEGGYFDPTLNMYAYIWKEIATINLYVTDSNTPVKYYFSLDDGVTWEVYIRAGESERYYDVGAVNAVSLVFNENYFPDGINNAFTFKAVNKAGTEYIYSDKIYIAIDTMVPEFEVVTTVGGIIYNGGSTNLSDQSAANWSSLPVTINIDMIKQNKSGVKLTYLINYLDAFGQGFTSVERETPSTTSFTTDRLDGFNYNRDALITIRATNRANSDKQASVTFRVKVDQVKPVFTLTGHASNDESTATKDIVSGEWTSFQKVAISKAADADHVNVSGVSYKYTYTDLESTGAIENVWPEGNPTFDKICTITVTATTDAGLQYTQVFQVNIDTIKPVIKFSSNISVVENEKHYIDLRAFVEEENIDICEYITTKGETRGFALDPTGYIISTSSVDNSIKYDPANNNEEYRGYVKIYVKDYAGNEAKFELYMLPFALDVNNVTLSDEDRRMVDKYEEDLNEAETYMESSRVTYFRNLISRLRDRISTLENEIATYRAYLERLAQRSSFELKSDYYEMYNYLKTFNDYEIYNQKWIQEAITGDASSKYYGYFENFLTTFASLEKQMEKVFDVEDKTKKLSAVNVVEAGDYNDVLRVYDEYVDLTPDQKACFTANLYNKLTALKKRCEILLLSDEDTGVKLDANFAPGAKIKVQEVAKDSETFNVAQNAVYNTIQGNAAKYVTSIYQVSLTGVSSQTSTGKITVTLPIPEDFQQYINFAVYTIKDGTVSTVEDMKISGDGRTVTFTSEELSTYVLATRANVQINTSTEGVYGTFLGLELDKEMLRTLLIVVVGLFVVVIVVVIIAGVRHRRFLNTYNKAYRSGIYRRGVQRIPKGNTLPRENPLQPGERVKTQKKPY